MADKVKKSNKKSGRPVSARDKQIRWFNNSGLNVKKDTWLLLLGLFLVGLGLYILIAFGSYIFSGAKDQSIVYNMSASEVTQSETVSNISGVKGAFLMHNLVHGWFGISIVFFIYFLIATGIKILRGSKGGYFKLFFFSFACMFWGALFLGALGLLLKSNSFFLLGGIVGNKLANASLFKFGVPGTVIILILTLIAIIVFSFQSATPKLKNYFQAVPKDDVDDLHEVEPVPNEKKRWFKWKKKKQQTDVTEDLETTFKKDEEQEIKVAPIAGERELNIDPSSSSSNFEEIQVVPQDPNTLPHLRNDDKEVGLEVVRPELEPEDEESLTQSQKLLNEQGEYNPHLELSHYKMPTLDLLHPHKEVAQVVDMSEIEENKERITETLKSFMVDITSIRATVGPTITLYEVVPDSGVRISRIRNLEDDIALSLAALGIRIIAPIPGKGTIGIEVPNKNPQLVGIRSLLGSKKFLEKDYELPVALGRTITNEVFSFDLSKIPHLLVAGATGQGKSVGLNTIIVSLLYNKHPSELKFVMVDPKMVEFSVFSKIQNHYLAKLEEETQPIITDTNRVVSTLNSLCKEMDERYELLTKGGVRNIKEYNQKFKKRKLNPLKGHRFLPYIVVVIDEYGDLIMTAGKDIELPLARLAQKARAVGIHAIIATQRPTSNIITGNIKANFPGRISFKVYSSVDSRTILDMPGANRLVGRGDLLYSQGNDPVRVQCAFISTEEINNVVDYIASQQAYSTPYILPETDESSGGRGGDGRDIASEARDELFEDAARLLLEEQSGSTSFLQRRLSIGFARAGRIMDQLEFAGIVGPQEGSKPRQMLIHTQQELESILDNL